MFSESDSPVRPGSRADRMARPVARDVLRDIAEHAGVCTRPLAIRRVDTITGAVDYVDVPCGARLASKCKPCAERNRRLRQKQIREGWHLAEEPMPTVEKPTAEAVTLLKLRGELTFERQKAVIGEDWSQVRDIDRGIGEVDELLCEARVRGSLPQPGKERRPRAVRSTRRRQDAPKLPRPRMSKRTIGEVIVGSDGKKHRSSMLLTVTLPGFGAVHTGRRMRRGHVIACECGSLHGQSDPLLGTPSDPDSYDYRTHALALIFFSPLLDRFWQNYRRAAGWRIQYAGAVEMQRRLATHAHYAVRGTVARALTKQVAEATYHQVWWPAFDRMVYSVERPPVWLDSEQCYVDPKTGQPLTLWADAIEALSTPDAEPAHVVRLGTVDVRGIEAGTQHAERAIRYATKYITKDLADQTLIKSDPQRAHANRLHAELATLPCSSRCANWLLYGVQPDKAGPDLVPGHCRGKVHQRTSLGYTGRRCLVSRNWSGKTLTDHRLDGRDWFRAVTAGLLANDNDHQDHADITVPANGDTPDKNRYVYRRVPCDDHNLEALQERIMRSVAARERARLALRIARDGPRAVPATQTGSVPAGQHQPASWDQLMGAAA